MNNIVDRAKNFAMLKHTGQVRKYDGQPYIVHPIAVKDLLVSFNVEDEATLAAALLHDTVEDTATTIQEIRKEFGDVVAEYVWWLTDYKSDKEGNRETRKLITSWKLCRAPVGVKLIKLADLIHNTSDIVKGDADFAKVYLGEKKQLLEEMKATASAGEWFIIADMWFEAMGKVR